MSKQVENLSKINPDHSGLSFFIPWGHRLSLSQEEIQDFNKFSRWLGEKVNKRYEPGQKTWWWGQWQIEKGTVSASVKDVTDPTSNRTHVPQIRIYSSPEIIYTLTTNGLIKEIHSTNGNNPVEPEILRNEDASRALAEIQQRLK